MKIRLVIAGRGYDAAQTPDVVELSDGATVADALAAAFGPDAIGQLAASTLVIAAGRHLGTLGDYENVPLVDDAELMLLQPVAGG
ncbi:MAG: hypothetical protein WD875_18865 [Pirellulales bacterium]